MSTSPEDEEGTGGTELGQDPSGHTIVPPNSDPFGADGARGDGLPEDPASEQSAPGPAEAAGEALDGDEPADYA